MKDLWPDPKLGFWRNAIAIGVPATILALNVLISLEMNLLDVVMSTGIADSKSDALRTFKQNGFRVNHSTTNDPERRLFLGDLVRFGRRPEPVIYVARGKGGIRYSKEGGILMADHVFVFTPWENVEPWVEGRPYQHAA